MNILFLTDNFYPESNAPAKRTLEHCKEWSRQKHNITIITGVPNFPKGKVFDGYKNKIYQSEIIYDLKIKRVWTFISSNEGFFLRIFDYISFLISSFFCGIFSKKHDIIIATSPQFFTLLSGYFISLIRRTSLVLEIRDLWPESIVTVGAMSDKSMAIKVLKKISLFLYKKSDLIICVTKSFKKDLISRGINHKKIKVVENGFDLTKNLKPSLSIKEVEKKFKLSQNKFYVSFIGTIGMAHGLEIVLNAALKVNDNVEFLIIGEGAKKTFLKNEVKKRKIKNIKFIDNLNWQEIVNINQLINIHLVHLKKDAEFKKVIPSKIFESMALKKPIIMGVDGESREIVNNAECAFNIEPENFNELVNIINTARADYTSLENMGEKGYNFLKKNFSRKILSNKMIKYLESVINY
jgi:glycosyltransferase involved in cell wall biosynthesis